MIMRMNVFGNEEWAICGIDNGNDWNDDNDGWILLHQILNSECDKFGYELDLFEEKVKLEWSNCNSTTQPDEIIFRYGPRLHDFLETKSTSIFAVSTDW